MRFLRFLTSMKTAIGLLILLGLIASLGTFIPQGMDASFYTEHYGPSQGQALLALGFNHLYSTPWFIGLLALLVGILLLCSVRRMRIAQSSKGLGSLLIHLSFAIVLLAAAVNILTGVEQEVKLSPGEGVQFREGSLSGYDLELENFDISYYDNGTPSQYTAKIALKDPQGINYHQKIQVNKPFKRDRISIYQQAYGWEVQGSYRPRSGETLPFKHKDNAEIPLEDSPFSLMTVFVPTYDPHSNSFKSLLPEARNPVLAVGLIEGDNVAAMTLLRPGESRELGQGMVHFKSFAPYSGLLVKREFGTPIAFLGFGLMLLGFVLRYLPTFYRRRKEDPTS